MFVVSYFGIYAALYLIPNKKIPFISKWGQNSLYIYVIHRFVTLIPEYFLLKSEYEHIYLVYFVVFTLIILIIFGSNWFKKIIDNFINCISNLYIKKEKFITKVVIMIFIGFLLIVPLCNLIYYIK